MSLPSSDPDALHTDSAVHLLEQVADAGLWRLDLTSGVLHPSRWLRAWLDVPGSLRVRPHLIAAPWRARLRAHVRACARRGDPFDCHAQLITRQGRQWARILGQAVRGAGGGILGVEGVVQAITPQAVGRDVTQRQATEHWIRHLAFHDPLTGLPNRQLLLERLHIAFERRAGAHGGGLIFIDLDHFKILNDTRGHDQGDRLLQQVAARLLSCVAHGDTVARLGGDEFVVLLASRADGPRAVATAAAAVAHRIRRALGAPYPLPGGPHHGTCSIGVTVFGPQPAPVAELMKQADRAMYQAKRAGGDRVCFFDSRTQALA